MAPFGNGCGTCHNPRVAPRPPDSPPPPDSWPGAGGKRSVAPDVPSWPGAAPRSETGGSWPGANRSDSWPGAQRRSPGLPSDDDDADRAGGVAGILFPAVSVVLVLAIVGLWVFLDADHREQQMIVLGVVVVVALAALGVSAFRHRSRV